MTFTLVKVKQFKISEIVWGKINISCHYSFDSTVIFNLTHGLNMNNEWYTGTLCFIVLCFIVFHRCCHFYKLKARPCTSKKIMLFFWVILEQNLQYFQGMPAVNIQLIHNYLLSAYCGPDAGIILLQYLPNWYLCSQFCCSFSNFRMPARVTFLR